MLDLDRRVLVSSGVGSIAATALLASGFAALCAALAAARHGMTVGPPIIASVRSLGAAGHRPVAPRRQIPLGVDETRLA
jgi:hypothetical protein